MTIPPRTELLRRVTLEVANAIVAAKIVCPRCLAYSIYQPLHPESDDPLTLFCPHCLYDVQLVAGSSPAKTNAAAERDLHVMEGGCGL